MFEALFYTYVNGLLQSSQVAERGLVAMWDPANTGKVKVSDGYSAIGVFAQNVKAVPENGYRPDVYDDAYLDGRVGIYQDFVVFLTDQVAGPISNYRPGDTIYVTSEGKYTNVKDEQATPAPTPTTGIVAIGEVLAVESGAVIIRARF